MIINKEKRSKTITSLTNHSTLELTFICNQTNNFISFTDITDPIINALDSYKIVDTKTTTDAQDGKLFH